MNLKLIVTDLDRTLLHTDKTISSYARRVLYRCREAGMRLVFATARPVRTVAAFLQDVPCDAVIYHNGALTLSNGAVVGERYPVPRNDALRILRYMQEQHPARRLSVEMNDTLYANFNVREFWPNTDGIYSDFTDLPDQDADKVLIEISSPEEYREVCSILPSSLYGELSDGTLCLIMNRRATKWNAISKLAAAWGIPFGCIAAFGDDYNDVEMLRRCGVGVAVANAIDEVRAAADSLTLSNDEDGVAVFLEQCLKDRG